MKQESETRSKDGKMWATIQKKNYGFLILSGRKRDGNKKGHFEIHLPDNNLGSIHPRGFIKEIRRQGDIVFSDPKAKKTRTIRIRISETGTIKDFAFVENLK